VLTVVPERVGEPDVTALVAILLDRTARIDERDDAVDWTRHGYMS
jgi:hypothetical protein